MLRQLGPEGCVATLLLVGDTIGRHVREIPCGGITMVYKMHTSSTPPVVVVGRATTLFRPVPVPVSSFPVWPPKEFSARTITALAASLGVLITHVSLHPVR